MTRILKDKILYYQRHGFILLNSVIPERIFQMAQEIADSWVDANIGEWIKAGLIKEQFRQFDFSHRFLEAWRAAGKPQFRRQPNKWLICPAMYKFLHDKFFINIASQILDTDELSVMGIFNARPMLPESNFSRQPWHQDSQYWGLDYGQKKDDPKRAHALTMFIPLQDVDTNSGCLKLMSKEDIKSNVLPPVDYDYASTGYLGLSKEDIAKYPHHEIEMKRGDLLCFNHLVPHGTQPHKKNYVRWTFDIRYEPTNIATQLGKKFGFVVNSKDPSLITPMNQWLALKQ